MKDQLKNQNENPNYRMKIHSRVWNITFGFQTAATNR